MMKRILYFTITVLLLSTPALAGESATLRGTVVKVIDADTIEVQIGGSIDGSDAEKIERVRVAGINAPEKSAPFGKAARDFTSELVLGKKVKLLTRGRGVYGRLIAFVIFNRQNYNGSRSLGLELVREGLARVYANQFRFESEDTFRRYVNAQAGAMLTFKNIWGVEENNAN